MAETEDVSYNAPDFATPDEDTEPDSDQPNKSVLTDASKYLAEKIAEHNSFDVINPEAENTLSTQQQVVVHKQVVIHLRNIKTLIDTKLKELR